jgi:RNA polymerase sigma factor for flagellar operon FliA
METTSPHVVEARVKEALDLVSMLARQLRRTFGERIDVDDLRSAGQEALVLAAHKFDESRGVPFRRWANLRIRGGMIDSLRKNGNLPRRVYAELRAIEAADLVQDAQIEEDAAKPTPTPVEADANLTNYLANMATAMALGLIAQTSSTGDPEHAKDPKATADESIERGELLAALQKVIDERPEAERALIRRHYFDGLKFEEVARELGLSKSWASRLHARAIEGVRKTLVERDLL